MIAVEGKKKKKKVQLRVIISDASPEVAGRCNKYTQHIQLAIAREQCPLPTGSLIGEASFGTVPLVQRSADM